MPHLDAAFNLTRWLLKSPADAEDFVQEAMLLACRSFAQFHGDNARGWVLQIVRHSCYAQVGKNRPSDLMTPFDEEKSSRHGSNPEKHLPQGGERQRLILEMESLAPCPREVLILKELEGCSYQEIAEITGIPIDAVASILSLARRQLVKKFDSEEKQK